MITVNYLNNSIEKSIKLPMRELTLSKFGNTQYEILKNTWNSFDKEEIEYKVLHDIIYYLSKGNFIRTKEGDSNEKKIPILFPIALLDKNISGSTNTMGACLFLIIQLSEYEDFYEEASILTGILESMQTIGNFTNSSSLPVIND